MKRGPGTAYRRLQTARFALTRDREAIARFLREAPSALWRRWALLNALRRATDHVRGFHSNAEMLEVGSAILARPGATVVECGAGPGGSTVKLSLFVRAVHGRLLVFDTFRGIPPNDEADHHLDGRPARFRAGAFLGRLGAVRRAVERYGAPEVCTFVKGRFEDTLAASAPPRVDVALLDVDLVVSTRCCVQVLHPRLAPTGVMFSQDGHLQGTVDLLRNPSFWTQDVGSNPPEIAGLGERKLLRWSRTT